MQGSSYSFLDLTVMPFARKRVISDRATLLFDGAFNSVLWANAAGTGLFANGHVVELLEAKLSAKHALVSQIKIAAEQIDDDGEIVRNFRIAKGLRTITLQGAVKAQPLPDGALAYLVIFESLDKQDRKKEHVLAEDAVNSLDGFADASAIVDEYGLPIASSDDFDALDVLPSVIAQLVKDTASESDRLVKRHIVSESGNTLAAGIGRIHDLPSRYIVVLAELDDETATETTETETVSFNQSLDTQSAEEEADDINSPPWRVVEPDGDSENSENVEIAADIDTDIDVSTLLEASENLGELPPTSQEYDGPSLTDRWKIGDVQEARSEEASALSPPGEEQLGKDRSQNERPVRFAFTIGSDLIFNSVSPELQATVGNLSGDVIGASWSEIASQYNFDENGSIKSLLEKADTWSGKSVLWPVENTDMVMPVDLAALPVFTKDRIFDGFRGFGIIRTGDAVVDVEGIGMLLEEIKAAYAHNDPSYLPEFTAVEPQSAENGLSKNDESPQEDDWDTKPIANDDDNDDNGDDNGDDGSHKLNWQTDYDANLDSKNEQVASNQSNIISIDGRAISSGEPNGNRLSKREANAFDDIRKRLESDQDESSVSGEDGKDRALLAQFDSPILIYNKDQTLFANAELLELSGYASVEELSEIGGISGLLNEFEFAEDYIDCLKLKRKDGSSVDVRPILKRVEWEGTKALCLTFKSLDLVSQQDDVQQRANRLPVDEASALEMVRVSDLENILDTAADGILVLRNDGKIDALNSSGEALFAKSQAEVVGNPFTSLFAKESQETLKAYLDNLKDPNVSSILNDGREVIGIESSGGLIPMFVSIGSIGESGRFCVVLRDLTERKKAEEELVTAKRAAETASEQKSEFLARMSHEIREPLNAIIGFSDIMIEERFGPVQNERYKEYLKDVNRSGIHVLDLVNDLLDISKIEAGKLELSYEAVDLNQLAAETVALLQPQANSRRIIIRTSLSRAVPKVVADARSIRQIILNLASNAIRHSPPNSQVIVSTTFEANGEVGLRVRDTGEGMNEEQLAIAMEPFSQIKSANMDDHGNTGLGLPLTKALIEANRAFFELESTPGQGTIAFVQFPSQRVLAD